MITGLPYRTVHKHSPPPRVCASRACLDLAHPASRAVRSRRALPLVARAHPAPLARVQRFFRAARESRFSHALRALSSVSCALRRLALRLSRAERMSCAPVARCACPAAILCAPARVPPHSCSVRVPPFLCVLWTRVTQDSIKCQWQPGLLMYEGSPCLCSCPSVRP